MISTFGKTTAVLVDSDALIGYLDKDDALHTRCSGAVHWLETQNIEVVILPAILLEAATTLAKDKHIQKPKLAKQLLEEYSLSPVFRGNDSKILELAAHLYNPKTSKRHSPFDYYILAAAQVLKISVIFSFDRFYKQNHLILLEDWIKKTK